MKPLFGLGNSTIAKIQDILRRYHEIEKAVIYGSRAKGNYREGSDIDLALLGNVNTKTVAEALDALDESFLPYTFDISAYDSLKNDKLREHIDRVGKVFYRREGDPGAGAKKGWEQKKLGEVCQIRPAKSEARLLLKPNSSVSFVPMEDLGIDQKTFVPRQERRLAEIEGSYTYFADNDVLLAKIAPCFENGKLGIAKNLHNGIGFGSSEYIVFRTSSVLYNEFLYYFLSQEEFRINGAKSMSGAVGHKRVAKDFMENTQIPLPPLPEQKRIVAILDEAFIGISRAKEIAEKNLANAKEVFESYLQGIFANPGEGWEEKTLGEVATFRNGMNFTKGSKGETIKIVGVKDFQNYLWAPLDNLDSVTIDGKLSDMDLLQKNDILAVRSNGNPALIGRTVLAGNVIEKVSHSGFTIRIRLDSNQINPIYLCQFLKLSQTRRKLVESGTGINIKSLNQGALSSLVIVFPNSLAVQKTVITKLDTLSAETKKLEEIYKQKISNLEELKKSILQKAFSGELIE